MGDWLGRGIVDLAEPRRGPLAGLNRAAKSARIATISCVTTAVNNGKVSIGPRTADCDTTMYPGVAYKPGLNRAAKSARIATDHVRSRR